MSFSVAEERNPKERDGTKVWEVARTLKDIRVCVYKYTYNEYTYIYISIYVYIGTYIHTHTCVSTCIVCVSLSIYILGYSLPKCVRNPK